MSRNPKNNSLHNTLQVGLSRQANPKSSHHLPSCVHLAYSTPWCLEGSSSEATPLLKNQRRREEESGFRGSLAGQAGGLGKVRSIRPSRRCVGVDFRSRSVHVGF